VQTLSVLDPSFRIWSWRTSNPDVHLIWESVTYYKRSLRAWLPYVVGTFASRDKIHKDSSGKLAEVQRPISSRE
jgi:hypothetical protein